MSLASAELLPEQLKQKLPEFMLRIQNLSEKLRIDLAQFQADHIALRINEVELAQQAHQAWLKEGKELSNAQINGRPIIVLAFHQPLKALDWQIECLELPYPAEGKLYPEQSWEHVEFVIPSQAQTAEEFAQELKQRFPSLAAQWGDLADMGIKVKLSSPKGEGERLNNPTVAFKHQGVCIKFHPHSLKAIVASEQSA
ncbi:hypothetical protein BIY22_20505 [Vibrio panuliri]|uniref:VOC family protein n=1 Tax=Vibrio panuliri TaxID=1381081 RepID=A0A1Q9HGB3_9VIBR|nr:VOC family protein [Vibrio panuliri]OLQ88963.1 hypothetical protein BIY22_20505 [Vibrio panuliri]